MKITETDRLELRQQLTQAIGSSSTQVLMEALPPVDYDQLATKADLSALDQSLRAEIAGFRGDMSELRGEVQESIGRLALENARQMRTVIMANLGSQLAFAGLILSFG